MNKKLLSALLLVTSIVGSSIAQTAQLTPLLEMDGAAITCISENGKWACGSTFNNTDYAGYQSNASKWNLETGERTYLVTQDELDNAQSDAFAITNDGSLIVGQYLQLPAYYTNGTWHTLELTQGYTIGEARDVAIIDGDTIIVGRIFDSDGYQKVRSAKWLNGKLIPLNELIPDEYRYNEDNKMANQLMGISNDGRTILGAFDPFTWPLRKPFVIRDGEFTLLDINTIEGLNGFHANADFFKEEKLNHNGKYVALSFFGHNTHIPCVYDTELKKFKLCKEAPTETGAKAIDSLGNVYYAGPMTTGFDRKSYVTIDNQAVHVDNILRSKFGVTQAEIDATCMDPDLTGSIRFIYDVAIDGKTIIGSAGYGTGGYNWVLKLSHTLFEVGYNPLIDAIDNIEYNNSAVFYANGCINIIGNANYIEVYNITGKLIASDFISESKYQVNLLKGIYIVKLCDENNHSTTSKLIIK